MSEPVWISQRAIHAIHDRQIAEHGGLPGVRDERLLQSALSRPENLFFMVTQSLIFQIWLRLMVLVLVKTIHSMTVISERL